MKRLLAALTFLALLFLVWFFWNQQSAPTPPVVDPEVIVEAPETQPNENTEEETEAETLNFKPQKREVKLSLEKIDEDIEIRSDEDGVFIVKIGDQVVEKRVSSFPVQRLTVRDGVMSFWEVNNETKSLKYRSINLKALLDSLKK